MDDEQIRSIRGADISMIFQEPMTSLNPVYTAGNQVVEAIMLHQKVSQREAEAKTVELFERWGFPTLKTAFICIRMKCQVDKSSES